uniref:Uncharacterized protein n=1 Tax=Romanomermis culicivorax TaxID=13658 RepID=A0A915HP49_ROMCU
MLRLFGGDVETVAMLEQWQCWDGGNVNAKICYTYVISFEILDAAVIRKEGIEIQSIPFYVYGNRIYIAYWATDNVILLGTYTIWRRRIKELQPCKAHMAQLLIPESMLSIQKFSNSTTQKLFKCDSGDENYQKDCPNS